MWLWSKKGRAMKIRLTSAVAALCAALLFTSIEAQGLECISREEADIVLLVDGSWSIGRPNFKTVHSFIGRVVEVFEIGPDKVQIALAQYSSDARTEWQLNSHNTKKSLMDAVTNLRYKGGNTLTGIALDFIRENNFKSQVGMREKARKIAVLLTDGKSQDDIVAPARRLKEQGIELYAVGIKKADENELKEIASDPDEVYMYNVADFSLLTNIVDSLTINLCNSVKGTVSSFKPPRSLKTSEPTRSTFRVMREPAPRAGTSNKVNDFGVFNEGKRLPLTGQQMTSFPDDPDIDVQSSGLECISREEADIVLLVDGSWSIGRPNFKTVRSFIGRVVEVFEIGADKVQIALAQYSGDPRTEWQLSTHKTKESLMDAVTNLPYKGGNTLTGIALDFIRENNFKSQVGMREKARKIAVLLTDGKSQDDIVAPARRLKEQGIELYAVGYNNADENELEEIASDPDEVYMYNVPDFSLLTHIVNSLTINLCNSVKGPGTGKALFELFKAAMPKKK